MFTTENFSQTHLKWSSERGFSFEAVINEVLREEATFVHLEDAELESIRLRFNSCGATRVVANPVGYPLLKLREHFFQEQAVFFGPNAVKKEGCCPEGFSLEYGLRGKQYADWSVQTVSKGITEHCQRIVLVAFKDDKPVGFFTLSLVITLTPKRKRCHLSVYLPLAYVQPNYRGQLVGFDLSVVASWLITDLICAITDCLPAGYLLEGTAEAEYKSKGGELMAEQVFTACELLFEDIKDAGCPFDPNKKLRIGEFEINVED